MLQLFFMSLCLIIGLLFSRMNHPLAMGLTLLLQTTLISLLSGLMAPSFWFAYILFLVFLGGMLVLFIYVTSLASNEMFSISSLAFMLSFLFLLLMFSILIFYDHLGWLMPSMNLNYPNNLMEMSQLPNLLYKLYNTSSSMLTIILIVYLFLTLVGVVTITNINSGPLRASYN